MKAKSERGFSLRGMNWARGYRHTATGLSSRLGGGSCPPFGDDGQKGLGHEYGIAESMPNLAESITGAVIISQTPYENKPVS